MSTSKEHLVVSLYENMSKKPDLDNKSQEKLNTYITQLANLAGDLQASQNDSRNSQSAWAMWEIGIKNFYREIIFNAFKDLKIDVPVGMEIHFAGSLAKNQATQYSDLDALLLCKDEKDVEQVKPVFVALNNLCQRIFEKNRQLCPDPIGINPVRLGGTVDSLIGGLEDDAFDNEPTVMSILTSKPIFGEYKLGEELRDRIRQHPHFATFCSAQKFYRMGIFDYPAPDYTEKTINIKTHLMRSIDFILMGLREEFDLYSEDGQHLSAPGTLKLLREQNLLLDDDIDRIERVYNDAMRLRFSLHQQKGQEHDEIDVEHPGIKNMLDDVAKLREMAKKRMDSIDLKESFPKKAESDNNSLRDKIALTALFIGATLLGAGIGVGLALTGVFVASFAVGAVAVLATALCCAAGGFALAALGYGIYKGIKSLVSESKEPSYDKLEPLSINDKDLSKDDYEMTGSYEGPLQTLGPIVVQETVPAVTAQKTDRSQNELPLNSIKQFNEEEMTNSTSNGLNNS